VVEFIESSEARDASVLIGAMHEANRRVLREASGKPELEGMGTTLVAALSVQSVDISHSEPGQQVAIASVGDSRAYICDAQGLRAVTEDQTWVEEVGRPLGLDDQSLRRHPMRHVLTMAIGVAVPVTVRYYSVWLASGSVMLLSSDGLHGVLEAEQIETVLRDPQTGLPQKCRNLVNLTNAAGGPDNVTVVLMQPRP
jgi:serine/threonine protein phosphatase PrpC